MILQQCTILHGSLQEYDLKETIYPMRTFIQKLINPGTNFVNITGPQSKVEDHYLTQIEFPNGIIDFTYSNAGQRLDIPYSRFLKSIKVNNNSSVVKEVNFNYSYFGSSYTTPIQLNQGDYSGEIFHNSLDHPDLKLRLRLGSVAQNDLTQSFEYYDNFQIPTKTTLSQDYWGFYNGQFNSDTFIPEQPDVEMGVYADRIPNQNYSKIFSLRKIYYPTGGYEEFDYELNTYDRTNFDYDFYMSYIPYSYSERPLNTVEVQEDVQSSGENHPVIKDIPSVNSSQVHLRFDLAIYGSNVPENQRGPGGHPFNFQTDMVLLVRDGNGIVWQQTFDSNQAPIDFQNSGQAFLSVEIERNLVAPVQLEAYFNDHEGLYFGRGKVTATYETSESQLSNEDFSFGGGLRMKGISQYEEDGSLLLRKNYNYHYKELIDGVEVEKSYGKLKVLPSYKLSHPYYMDSYGNITNVVATSASINPLSKSKGSYVGYSQISESYINEQNIPNGSKTMKFYNFWNYMNRGNVPGGYADNYYRFDPYSIPHDGKLKEENNFSLVGNELKLVSSIKNFYEIDGINAEEYDILDFWKKSDKWMSAVREMVDGEASPQDPQEYDMCLNFYFQFHPYYSNLVQLTEKQIETFDLNGQNPISENIKYYYENLNHYQLVKSEKSLSDNHLLVEQFYYPDDITNINDLPGGDLNVGAYEAIEKMKKQGSESRAGQLIQKITSKNDRKEFFRTDFKDWGAGKILPQNVQDLKFHGIGSETFQIGLNYLNYDSSGNPVELSKPNGPHIVFLWGYNKQHPIARIANATYDQVSGALGGVNLSDVDESFLPQVNNLRDNSSLSNALITTYEYEPLVGVTKVTDPKRNRTTYHYDPFNRLEFVKDEDGNIVKEHKYKYKIF